MQSFAELAVNVLQHFFDSERHSECSKLDTIAFLQEMLLRPRIASSSRCHPVVGQAVVLIRLDLMHTSARELLDILFSTRAPWMISYSKQTRRTTELVYKTTLQRGTTDHVYKLLDFRSRTPRLFWLFLLMPLLFRCLFAVWTELKDVALLLAKIHKEH